MNSLNFPKYSIFIVILLQLYQLSAVQPPETFITEWKIEPISTIDHRNITRLTLRCSWESRNDIAPAIRANALSCDNKMVNTDDISHVTFEKCSFSSLPPQVLKNFHSIGVLNLTGLSLRVLNCVDLPESKKHSLRILYMADNHLQYIEGGAFRHQKGLELLELDRNRLQHVSEGTFAGLFQLRTLSLAHNEISDVSERAFHHMTRLESLQLYYNHIRTIGESWFHEQNQLKILNLAENSIVHLNPNSFRHLRHLIDLDLSRNQIVGLPARVFEPLTKLYKLSLHHNRIHRIGTAWIGPENKLEYLYLQNNNFTELKRFYFGHLTKLINLDVSQSMVKHIRAGTLASLPNLDKLILRNNQLRQFDANALFNSRSINLSLLDISSNFLSELIGVQRMLPHMQNLIVKDNRFNCTYLEEWTTEFGRNNRWTRLYVDNSGSCEGFFESFANFFKKWFG